MLFHKLSMWSHSPALFVLASSSIQSPSDIRSQVLPPSLDGVKHSVSMTPAPENAGHGTAWSASVLRVRHNLLNEGFSKRYKNSTLHIFDIFLLVIQRSCWYDM